MKNNSLAVGVDIGGTKVASILVNQDGEILASDYRMTAVEMGKDETIRRVAESINCVVGDHRDVCGIGIDIPGSVDPEKGMVENAVNLGWDRVELRKELGEKLTVDSPIYLQRDTYAQTLGEYYFGVAKNVSNYVYLAMGSGLGGGAMVNGKLLLGNNRSALEIGHLGLTGLTTPCACGKIGCAETLLSGPGMVRTYLNQEWHPEFAIETPGSDGLTAQDILTRAQSGEMRASLLMEQVSRYLGELISDILMVLNPSMVVIAGGVGLAAFDVLLPGVESEIAKRTWKQNYVDLVIKKSVLNSSALGAATLVWYSMSDSA